jgi:mRNA interferase MazF
MNMIQIKHGFLYLANLGEVDGTEVGKTRPVLVIQNDFLNSTGHSSTWILPCTTKLRGDNILRCVLPKNTAGNTQDCEVMIDQSRTIDNKKFLKELKPVPKILLKEIKEKLSKIADL